MDATKETARMVIEDWRIAVVVDPSLAPGLLANTVAVIAIGIGAACPRLAGDTLSDIGGRSYRISANRPVPILQADYSSIQTLLLKALPAPQSAVVVPFPSFARSVHAYQDYAVRVPTLDLGSERLDGIGLAGPTRWVRSLTGALKLFR
jgi:uncharacterized protein DUF2000